MISSSILEAADIELPRWLTMAMDTGKRFGERLRRMKRDELLDRSRQALAKRADSVLARLGYDFAKPARTRKPATPGNFFFAPEQADSILELLRERTPGRIQQIIQEAEQICRHRFDLLGHSALDYGNEQGWNIDWRLDAVHGKRAPKKAFYRVRYLDYDECGDSKVIWELNRHQHLVTLAKAFRLTGDRRYADEILRQQRHWMAKNPYSVGINWASSLEVAFRSLSWLWTLYLLEGSPGVPRLREEWLRGLSLHGRHIERYLSTYFSPNTHLLGEAVGLFFLGVLCPELARAERWKSLGWEIILQESEHQVRDDGCHFEQSTCYHVYALDFFVHAAVLAAANNIPAPKSFEEKIEKMLNVLYLLGREGPPPQFGDDDGGRLFDPRRNRSQHLLDPLATGAVLFHRPDFKAAVGDLREETLWLLGEEGARQWDQLQTGTVSREPAALPDSGYYVLNNDDSQLVVDAGPLGAHTGGHGHADALSVCLNRRGRSLLIDPGTFEYVGPGHNRDSFRGTAMHNTLRVDGEDQAKPATIFSWRRLTQSKVERWIQGHSFDLLVASHDGYQRLPDPVIHRRCVLSLKNGIYLVRDVVEGVDKHRLDIAWHLGQDLERVENLLFRVKKTAHGLAFLPAQMQNWTQEVRQESCSTVYGQKTPMTALNFTANLDLPTEFTIMLAALDDLARDIGSFKSLEQPHHDVSSYEFSASGTERTFFFHEFGGPWQCGAVSSDAKYVCHRRGPRSFDEQLIFCDGTYAKVERGPQLRCCRSVAWAESTVSETGRQVFSSDLSAVMDEPAAEPSADPTPAVSGGI